ncbi:TetR/AcrR family transcriptional regulator [Planctomonas sp. JC2975]|uniref:TetR/AcrR family transcriptional regulator n=1 Tax=Planctomonas sp. JC2975 TaxID=2729626 RepID=UPI0014764B36|nr:TetR/AcrR family transcriptional regulator [Planctomonas sp. JC2975]NNC10552.1 TetR/AcrR family transcriptional regulator [Planctomonas sp. JC2975]
MSVAGTAAPHCDPPTRSRRGRPGHDREQVLVAAVALFNEKGYDATSVADLADRLGLTKSALYHHFESKEELLSLALDEALAGLERVIDEPAARTGSAAAQLAHVITGAVTVLIEKLPYVTLLLRVRGNSPVEAAALERRREFDRRVADVVRRAQRDGLLRDDVDASVATRLLFGMVNSLVEWYRPDGTLDAHAMGSIVLATALDGLRARGGSVDASASPLR